MFHVTFDNHCESNRNNFLSSFCLLYYYRRYTLEQETEEKELKKEEKLIKPNSERTGNDQEIKSDAKEVNITLVGHI